jgi:glycosyltransferase involved in cell wall biosynthesis
MRLLFVADGRSPTTLSWLKYWIETGHQTHLVSTYPCDPPPGLASYGILPVAFAGMARNERKRTRGSTFLRGLVREFRGLLLPLRHLLGPLTLPFFQKKFRKLVKEIRPDLVHALRIPFEGMLASATPKGIPLVISIWGNDLTLHARSTKLIARLTGQTLRRADALIADTARDIHLGTELGFSSDRPTLVVPGAGGIHLEEIDAASRSAKLPEELPDVQIVVNPRGQRPGSLRQDVFFQSIPHVLEIFPKTFFICPPLAGDKESEHWVETLGIGSNTRLWPHLDRAQMWALLIKADVFVSPSIHDGTPNSLLEAMACGCFPVVGNIESMREWISPGVSGLLVDATSPRAMANGIITALENSSLRSIAKIENARTIAERATFQHGMAMAEAFYLRLKSLVA